MLKKKRFPIQADPKEKATANNGILKDQLGSLSGYGCAARFLQHHIRDRAVLSLAEGLRKIISIPAERLGLVKQENFASDTTLIFVYSIPQTLLAMSQHVIRGGTHQVSLMLWSTAGCHYAMENV